MDTITILAQGTRDEFIKCGKAELAPDITEMKGVFFNLKRKYLNAYNSEDAKDEIIRDAWVASVLENRDKIIESFTGFNPTKKDQKVKAKDYIALVMRNAVINASIKATKDLVLKGENDEANDYEEVSNLFTCNPAKNRGVNRRDDDYINALQGYIEQTREALINTADNKTIARRRLESSLKALEKDLAEAQDYHKPAPIMELSDIYDYFDEDSTDFSDSNYEARMIQGLLVRLSAEEQCVFVGLFYGMTPYELKVALNKSVESHLENIKLQVIELAESERWWNDNPDLLEALESYDFSARDTSRILNYKQKDALLKYSECLKAFKAEFGLNEKVKQLKAIVFGLLPEITDEV